MKNGSERTLGFSRDGLKLLCVVGVVAATVALFQLTPSLSIPALLSLVGATLLSPIVAALERRGLPPRIGIALIFALMGATVVAGGFSAFQHGQDQWSSFEGKAPEYFAALVQKLKDAETELRKSYPAIDRLGLSATIVGWVERSGKWFAKNGASWVGELVTCLLIAPILTFFLLSDGRALKKRFFQLIPNRFFESAFLISSEISRALGDYLRAKLIEAFLVGGMVGIGLALVQAPYALVLGVLAGLTNIIPYAGPFLGAIPGIAIVAIEPSYAQLLWPVATIYLVANLVDTFLIFPIVVAKLVNLHPLLLLAVVAIGSRYYGLVGMLISIPIASAIKVVLLEIYLAVYGGHHRRPTHPSPKVIKAA